MPDDRQIDQEQHIIILSVSSDTHWQFAPTKMHGYSR